MGWGSIVLLFLIFSYNSYLKNYTQSGRKNKIVLLVSHGISKPQKYKAYQTSLSPPKKKFDIYPYAYAMGSNTVWANKFVSQLAIWQISKFEGRSYYVGVKVDHLGNNFEVHLSSFENSFSAAANYRRLYESGGGGGG